MTHYKRVVLKLSGEILAGKGETGISAPSLHYYVDEIRTAQATKCELVVVIGGGNFWRGVRAAELGIGRVEADHIGMLATLMNGLALHSTLVKEGVPARLMSRLPVPPICEPYSVSKALHHLHKGRIVVVCGGTGNAGCSTDTAGSLTAIELSAEVLLKGTKVDGVYAADPATTPHPIFYERITLQQVIEQGLRVMDSAALGLCRDHQLPIIVYNAMRPKQLATILTGGKAGTMIMTS